VSIFVGALVACSSSPKPPPQQPQQPQQPQLQQEPVGETHPTAATTTGAAQAGAQQGQQGQQGPSQVYVSQQIQEACNLPTGVCTAPRFDFNGIDFDQRGSCILQNVSSCLSTGPLAGKKVCITGKTDPRGSEQYNYGLGLARAYSTSHYLERLGVSPGQTEVRSCGKRGAHGTDEASYQLDRRVEIDLADSPDSPCSQQQQQGQQGQP
jgi:peptidoglycan-associated lipoprotein